MTKRRCSLALVVLAAFATACDQPSDAPTSPYSSEGSTLRQLQHSGAGAHPDLDEEWAQIARGVAPGFSGFHRANNGDYVVGVTRPEHAQRALDYVRSRLLAEPGGNVTIRVRVVRWAFDQLKPWKDALTSIIDGEEVYWLDIDEVQNLLVFGVGSEGSRGRLLQAAESLGIPTEAVSVVETRRPVERTTVRDRIRPTLGGVQVQSDAGTCTLGFNAYRGSSNGFVTASHCSTTKFGTDGTVQHQPTISSSDRIGVENFDPSGSRHSDAAFYLYDSGVERDWGHIARTTFPKVGEPGSLELDPNYPKFRITTKATQSAQGVGELVNKVGRTSGWTQGQVTRSCVTLANLPCQWEALLWSEPGDSGSPMFRQNGSLEPEASRVALWGILWGGPEGDWTTTWYSTVSGVEQDLGTLEVACDPNASTCEPPPPPPPSVSIIGPSEVQQHVYCVWSASVTDGTAPFTYEWRRDNQVVSTASDYTTDDTGASDFLLEVYVTDALNDQGFTYLNVQVEGFGQIVCE